MRAREVERAYSLHMGDSTSHRSGGGVFPALTTSTVTRIGVLLAIRHSPMMSLSPHRYEGYWRNDQPHGVGRMTNPKGEVRRTLHTQRRSSTRMC